MKHFANTVHVWYPPRNKIACNKFNYSCAFIQLIQYAASIPIKNIALYKPIVLL